MDVAGRLKGALLLGGVAWCGLAGCAGAEDGRSTRDLLLLPDHPEWSRAAPNTFVARFVTSAGAFEIEVQREWAPHGADRFFNLCRLGFYDEVRFSRVVPDFIVQWGLNGVPAVTRAWKGRTIPDDSVRASNMRGRISYAMTGPDTRSTQVYISLVDNSRLDSTGFAPFGQVVEGMDVVDRLFGDYGEASGGGMRAGNQAPVEEGGNVYLNEHYPELDHIIRVELVP